MATGLSFSMLSEPALAAPNPNNGKVLFENNCAVCHAAGRNLVRPERSLDSAKINKYLDGGLSEESIAYQIYVGKNAMPGFASRLSVD